MSFRLLVEPDGHQILVGQLAASQTSVSDWANFVYMRKSVKETGTRQQLEGPYKFTSRTPESAPLAAIWLDDCISTGSSLVKAVEQLKDKYNIHIEVAAFIVDRSADRVSLKVCLFFFLYREDGYRVSNMWFSALGTTLGQRVLRQGRNQVHFRPERARRRVPPAHQPVINTKQDAVFFEKKKYNNK